MDDGSRSRISSHGLLLTWATEEDTLNLDRWLLAIQPAYVAVSMPHLGLSCRAQGLTVLVLVLRGILRGYVVLPNPKLLEAW